MRRSSVGNHLDPGPVGGGSVREAQQVDGIGAANFVARAEELESKYGPRFAPPALLKKKAEKGEAFYSAA